MAWLTRATDKAGAFGSVVAAASCPACFPALASLGAAMGLGFLAPFEGFMLRLLPLFAVIALVAHALGWFRHRQWQRSAMGIVGPVLVLAGLVLFAGPRGNAVLYTGLAFMVGASLWDLLSPANKRCGPEGCELPAAKP